jgi:hypothetical protein
MLLQNWRRGTGTGDSLMVQHIDAPLKVPGQAAGVMLHHREPSFVSPLQAIAGRASTSVDVDKSVCITV